MMSKVVKWAVFYDNGDKCTSDIFKPEDVPTDRVQWIVEVMSNGGKRNVHGMDYYRWTGDSWSGGHMGDLKKWLLAYKPQSKWAVKNWTTNQIVEIEDWIRERWPLVKMGLWLSDADYAEVAKQVENCCDD